MVSQSHIRNFSIIAHIDHGKSTLADRLLEFTGAITEREFRDQLLDDMDLERERGITIKASAVSLQYKKHLLNLIDTPGHVDFSYEVSKSIAACEGTLLLVDASQGVQAQTVSNLHLAMEADLKIIPVVSKMDLKHADPQRVRKQLCELYGFAEEEVLFVSAKQGKGIEAVLDAIIEQIPPPAGNPKEALQALIFDSKFDAYKGVIVYTRVVNGSFGRGDRIRLMSSETEHEVLEVGTFSPKPVKAERLETGQVGYLTCNIKKVDEVGIGDTITLVERPHPKLLTGYKKPQPLVFSGLYPVNARDLELLRTSMGKLKLNDASFVYEPESSGSLGIGFRCGFLGLLHMDIIQERLEREFGLDLVTTAPGVRYRVDLRGGKTVEVDNPNHFPSPGEITNAYEPVITAWLVLPRDYIGNIMQLAQERRGTYKKTEYLDEERAMLEYELPLSEVLVDFNDKVKSITRGYGSYDYELKGYDEIKLVKLDILLNGDLCDSLSSLVVKERAQSRGRVLVERLKECIPRQLFEVAVQAAVGGKVLARETIKPLGKNVTGKCYGGDITRKRKLWAKQKAGKKRMKRFGRVELPQEAFLAVIQS